MTKLHDLIRDNASIEAIKLDLFDNMHIEGYVNNQEFQPRCSLSSAIYYNNIEYAELLLSVGADVNTQDREGYTPLHLAALSNRYNFVELLVNAGADITLVNDHGQTAVDLAKKNNYHECLALLDPEANYAMINGVKYKLLRCKS